MPNNELIVVSSSQVFTDKRTGDQFNGPLMYRLLALKSALKLEILGMKSRHRVADQIRNLIGSKTRNKVKLYDEYLKYMTALESNLERTS